MAGVTSIGPDCPKPVRGRCECPPDGSWRPSVGVIRADSAAVHAVHVPASRLRLSLEGSLWVAQVYEQAPDGLWHCRWPVRRALEHLRGVNPARWAIAVRLLRGDHVATVWGANGAPPDPVGEAIRLLRQLDRWAIEERETAWERRPRQWWDAPRKPKDRSVRNSESQANAEHERSVDVALTPSEERSYPRDTTEAATPGPRSVRRAGGSVEPRADRPFRASLSPEPSCV
jgi:hypothetical protein